MLFADKKRLEVTLPALDAAGGPASVGFLIAHLCSTAMTDGRKDLFVLEEHLCVSFSAPFPFLHLFVYTCTD